MNRRWARSSARLAGVLTLLSCLAAFCAFGAGVASADGLSSVAGATTPAPASLPSTTPATAAAPTTAPTPVTKTIAPVAPVVTKTIAPITPVVTKTIAPIAPVVTKTIAPVAPVVTKTIAPVTPVVTKTIAPIAPVITKTIPPSIGLPPNAAAPVSRPAGTNVQLLPTSVPQPPLGSVGAALGDRRPSYRFASTVNPLAGRHHVLKSSAVPAAVPAASRAFTDASASDGSGLMSSLTGPSRSLSSQPAHTAATAGGTGRSVPPNQRAPLGGGGSSAGGATGLFFLLFAATLACLGLALPAMGRRLRMLRERGAPLALVLVLDRPG
jgi:hypothetical protein